MEPQHLKSTLESILFVSSKPLTAKQLAKILEVEPGQVLHAMNELVEERRNSGVVILDNGGEYQMATNRANTAEVKNFLNADLREKLTDATVEVLAIIAYRQPISKAEIEAIRGVNSQYSLRHLLMRGMIEKIPNPDDSRSLLYQTTTDFLQHLGLVSIRDLPAFEELVKDIKLPETPQTAEVMQQPADEAGGQAENTDQTPEDEVVLVIEPEAEQTEPMISDTGDEPDGMESPNPATEPTDGPMVDPITDNTPDSADDEDEEDEDEYDDDEDEDDEDKK